MHLVINLQKARENISGFYVVTITTDKKPCISQSKHLYRTTCCKPWWNNRQSLRSCDIQIGRTCKQNVRNYCQDTQNFPVSENIYNCQPTKGACSAHADLFLYSFKKLPLQIHWERTSLPFLRFYNRNLNR